MKIPRFNGIVAGMDEAGRGSWAGPVFAAAVILPKGTRLKGLKDSKQLSAKARETLFEQIIRTCPHGIGMATESEVDEYGLLQATQYAFTRALENLSQVPEQLLIDGRDKFAFKVPHISIVRGDQKVPCISAASVLAKVSRDRIMVDYAKQYPNYGFELHKGYGTEAHQRSLRQFGPCELHRHSYKPLKALQCSQTAFL